ncbi:MAG: hypothetical protein GX254_11265 [Clostridiales bacterium]|nr:hypothetical protein [Clostridiales bacterium]
MRKTAILLMTIMMMVGLMGCSPENGTGLTGRSDVSEEPQVSVSPENTDTAQDEPSPNPTYEPTPAAGGEIGEPYTEVIQLEGMDETVNYKLVKGRFGYLMPMDIDRFEFQEGEEADYFRSIANENVFMTVLYINDTTAEAEARARMDVPRNATAAMEDVTIGAYEGKGVHIAYGSEPDSKIVDFYLIEHEGGVYEISHIYFLQAAEGFGARMYFMTQDFKIE